LYGGVAFINLYHVGDNSKDDREALLLTVEALKAQLEEQTRLCKEQVILQTIYFVVSM